MKCPYCGDLDNKVINRWKKSDYSWIDVYCDDGITYLENLTPEPNKQYCIYCDPPYPKFSRKQQHVN